MIKFLKRIFKGKWILVEAYTSVWNIQHGRLGMTQNFIHYKIEQNIKTKEFRLTTEGTTPEKHVFYGDMLKRIADLNTGRGSLEDETSDILEELDKLDMEEVEEGGITIVTLPLSKDAEEIWSVAKEDSDLINAINSAKPILKDRGIEIFEQRFNIIATDKGYYMAVWDKDLSYKDLPPLEDDTDETIE